MKEAKVSTLAELAANQESGGSSPDTVGAGTVRVEFTKQSPLQGASAGVFAVTFAGPPTQTNGTVSGNTVHWTLTGHESTPYIYATGPTASSAPNRPPSAAERPASPPTSGGVSPK